MTKVLSGIVAFLVTFLFMVITLLVFAIIDGLLIILLGGSQAVVIGAIVLFAVVALFWLSKVCERLFLLIYGRLIYGGLN